MKNFFFILLLNLSMIAVTAQDSSQTTFHIKDYSLRDYIAPDIQYRRLDLGSEFRGNGTERGKSNQDSFNGNANLNLHSYTNLTNYQGNSSTTFNGSIYYHSNRYDTNKNIQNNPSLELRHYSFHRLYNSKNQFLSLSPSLSGQYDYNRNKRSDVDDPNNSSQSGVRTNVSLGIAVGTGRIQPVTAARRAMDILISLKQYQRLSQNPTLKQMDSLAYLANEINYKRFFDKRFKRVYQLAELDSAINALDLVENRDMIYAANLSDIWNYGTSYSRGSGSRFEVGIQPGYAYRENNSENLTSKNSVNKNSYAFIAFAQWNKQVPINYKWQSDFQLSTGYNISRGIRNTKTETDFLKSEYKTIEEVKGQYLNSRWTLGYYPNTRTHFRLSPYVNFSASKSTSTIENQPPKEDNLFGMSTGINFSSYYYVSPRFRLVLTAGTSFRSNEYHYINSSVPPQPNDYNDFRYNYQLKLAYALF